MNEKSIIRLYITTLPEEEIEREKKLLFEVVDTTQPIKRKRTGKTLIILKIYCWSSKKLILRSCRFRWHEICKNYLP